MFSVPAVGEMSRLRGGIVEVVRVRVCASSVCGGKEEKTIYFYEVTTRDEQSSNEWAMF